MTLIAGIDIGGTKCAVSLARTRAQDPTDSSIDIIAKESYPTPPTPQAAIERLCDSLTTLLASHTDRAIAAIGVSCGGPLDSRSGVILSPPNLPGWDRIEIVKILRGRFAVPVALQNDANACALAEWRWGAGRGCRNMVFLTFGTGMGAGLILDGRLYSGTNDMAGEVGHTRLEPDGPIGYGKAGSFEGFCSGGGIAQLAREKGLGDVTAKMVAEAAERGDAQALEIFATVARQLGHGLALLVDILNPERIILGSIYGRCRPLLEPLALETLRQEALTRSLEVCEILPAGLGEQIGDYASLAVARDLL